MRRPTGFTMDYSDVALYVDVWCPDVVVDVMMCMCVCVRGGGCSCWRRGGGGGGGRSRRILASISMGGPNLKS